MRSGPATSQTIGRPASLIVEAVNQHDDLQAALLHVTARRHEHSDGCDGCLNVQRMVQQRVLNARTIEAARNFHDQLDQLREERGDKIPRSRVSARPGKHGPTKRDRPIHRGGMTDDQ